MNYHEPLSQKWYYHEPKSALLRDCSSIFFSFFFFCQMWQTDIHHFLVLTDVKWTTATIISAASMNVSFFFPFFPFSFFLYSMKMLEILQIPKWTRLILLSRLTYSSDKTEMFPKLDVFLSECHLNCLRLKQKKHTCETI